MSNVTPFSNSKLPDFSPIDRYGDFDPNLFIKEAKEGKVSMLAGRVEGVEANNMRVVGDVTTTFTETGSLLIHVKNLKLTLNVASDSVVATEADRYLEAHQITYVVNCDYAYMVKPNDSELYGRNVLTIESTLQAKPGIDLTEHKETLIDLLNGYKAHFSVFLSAKGNGKNFIETNFTIVTNPNSFK